MFYLMDAASGAARGGFDWSMIVMIVLMFAIVYFFMIRPQRNRQKKLDEFRKGLTIGSKVVTGGGVYGTVKSLNEGQPYVTIEISKGVTMQVNRNYVFAEDTLQAQQ